MSGNVFMIRCGCGQLVAQPNIKARVSRCEACTRKYPPNAMASNGPGTILGGLEYQAHRRAPKQEQNATQKHMGLPGVYVNVMPPKIAPVFGTVKEEPDVAYTQYARVATGKSLVGAFKLTGDDMRAAGVDVPERYIKIMNRHPDYNDWAGVLYTWNAEGLVALDQGIKMSAAFTSYPAHSKPSAGSPLWDPIAQTWGLRMGDAVDVLNGGMPATLEGRTLVDMRQAGTTTVTVATVGKRGFAVVGVRV